MKKILMTMAAVSAIAAASPAAAQFGNSNFDARISELRFNLQNGVQSGRITQNEAMQLRERLRQLSQLERQYRSDGFSPAERNELQQRIQTLRQQIRMAIQNGDNRPRYDDDDDRDYDDDDGDYRDGRRCPPGLAKKNNGCMPPGQVDRADRPSRDHGDAARYGYQDTNRYTFRYNDGRVYQIDRRTGRTVRVMNVRR